ncbi:hypothetical protein H6P81_006621 [Aristolochia fimbriata]|uniref:Cation/H+ exchanger domain-containing protein n=1 Tax=Aristolochia fimbriata TaxID=158543 RepID=A0AAV7F1A2_ARIFI|nr:hypothetical protein H6P81_006621 [Aristolochia fimbriata]
MPPAIMPSLTGDECDKAYAEGLGDFFMGLSAALLSTRFLHFFFKHIGQPRVLSEIIPPRPTPNDEEMETQVGMVIRNTALIEMVDTSLPRLVRIFSEFGIMSYFFVLGLEMEPMNYFRRRRPPREAVLAYSGIATTYLLLACLQFFIVKGMAPDDRARYIVSLGLTLSNTSSSVLTRLVTDLKVGKSEIGRLVINAGVHNDMTTLLLMALLLLTQNHLIGRQMKFVFSRTLSILLFLLLQTWLVRRGGRRGMEWIHERNPEGRPVRSLHVFLAVLAVVLLSALSNLMGYNGNVNAFLIGLTLPRESRVSRAFIRKINIWLAQVVFPLYYTFIGTLLTLKGWHGWMSLRDLSLLVLLGVAGKLVGSVAAATFMGFPISEAICIGLLLNMGIVNVTGFLTNIIAVLLTILYIPLVAQVILWRSRKRHAKLQMALQWCNPESELRIMTCLHSPKNVPSTVKMIEVTRGRPHSPPLAVFAADLVQLSGRTAAALTHGGEGMDAVEVTDEAINAMREEITMAFDDYLDGCGDGVAICRLLIVSEYGNMHRDICNAAQDSLAVLVVLPFHKKQRADGSMDDGHADFRAVNRKVLRHAPCSVGILVDRGLVGSNLTVSSLESFQVVVVFIGGPDDREALSYAARVAYYPGLRLTVIRFLLENDSDNVSTIVYGSKYGSNRHMILNSAEDFHVDDEFFTEFYECHVANGPVLYLEKHVSNGAETIAALREVESQYNLFIVGNGSLQLPSGMSDFTECPEVGPLGDSLASSEFSTTASVLVIRQHNPRRQEEEECSIEDEFSLRCCFSFLWQSFLPGKEKMSQGRLEWVSHAEGHMEVEKPRAVNEGAEDKKWSEKMMMTVDFLRKRLVAERTASKAAKENADAMEEKMTELEKLLKMEIEAKELAEKKLKLAMKKLKSLKLSSSISQSDTTEEQDSSPPPTTGMAELGISFKEEQKEEVADLSTAQDSEANLPGTHHNDIFANQVISREGSSCSVEHLASDNTQGPSEGDAGKVQASISSGDSVSDVPRLCSIGGDDETDEVDNSLALVLVPEPNECLEDSKALVVQEDIMPPSDIYGNPNRGTKDIYEVLVALQRAKAHLQSSIKSQAAVYSSHSFGLCGV